MPTKTRRIPAHYPRLPSQTDPAAFTTPEPISRANTLPSMRLSPRAVIGPAHDSNFLDGSQSGLMMDRALDAVVRRAVGPGHLRCKPRC
jgi:hypothetical protein